jgi:hypothetical protein
MATMPRRARAAAGRKERMAAKGRRATRRGLWGIARVVSLITSIVVGLIVVGIVLVLLEANRDNAIVDALRDAAAWLAGPFDNVFKLDGRKENVAVNYGLAALIYGLIGSLLARLLRR